MMTVSVRDCVNQARCLPVEAFEEGNQLRRTGFQLQQKIHFSIVARLRVLIPAAMSTYDAACSFVSSGALCTVSGMLLLLLFLTFSVLVANPKKLLYTVDNPARGLLNREERTKEEVWRHNPPPHPPHCSFG